MDKEGFLLFHNLKSIYFSQNIEGTGFKIALIDVIERGERENKKDF